MQTQATVNGRFCLRWWNGLFLWLILVALVAMESKVATGQAAKPIREIPKPQAGLAMLKDQPTERFTKTTLSELPAGVQQDIEQLALTLFMTDVLPFAYTANSVQLAPPARPRDAVVRVFAASRADDNDLIELTWQHRGLPLRCVLSSNIVAVGFPLDSFKTGIKTSPAFDSRKVQDFCNTVFRFKWKGDDYMPAYEVRLQWPAEYADGTEFSNASDKDIRTYGWWPTRVDGVVASGRLTILTYHMSPMSGEFNDGSKYFPDDFRKVVLARAKAAQK